MQDGSPDPRHRALGQDVRRVVLFEDSAYYVLI